MRSVVGSILVVAAMVGFSGCGGGGDGSSSPAVADSGAPSAEYGDGMASPSMTSAPDGGMSTPAMPGMEGDTAGYDSASAYPGSSTDPSTDPMNSAGYSGYPDAMGDPTSADPPEGYAAGEAGYAGADTSVDSTTYPDYGPDGTMPVDPSETDPAGMATSGAEMYGGTAGGQYGAGGPQEAPQDLLGRAKQALREGRDHDAFQFYYGHALMNDHAAQEILSEMQWFPLRQHPAMAIRWGVGINFSSGPGIQGNLFPIGTTQQFAPPARLARRGNQEGYEASMPDMGGAMDEHGGGGNSKNAELAKMTGDFGQQVVDQFMARLKKGDFGTFLKDAEDKPENASGTTDYGEMAGMAMGGGGGAKAAGDGTVQVTPGVTFLGLENEKKLLQRAGELDIDVLVVFDVNVAKAPRTGYTINTNKITLHDVRTGRSVYKSAVLTNIAVQKARESDKDKDPVEKEVESLFNFVDKTYRLIPMPDGMKAEHAIGMVKELISSSHDNPLPVLAEIKYFHTLGLLTDPHLESAYARVIDPPAATTLASGDEGERKGVLEAWLPK